jgi:hypothetical protein
MHGLVKGEPTFSNSVFDALTSDSNAFLKATNTVLFDLKFLMEASTIARNAIEAVVSLNALDYGMEKLASAAAIGSLSAVVKNSRKACQSIASRNVKELSISMLKAARDGCEVACGFGFKAAKFPRNGLSCALDVYGLYQAVVGKKALFDKSDLEKTSGVAARLTSFNLEIAKNISGLALHSLAFCAVVISPVVTAVLGTTCLVTAVLSQVYAKQENLSNSDKSKVA